MEECEQEECMKPKYTLYVDKVSTLLLASILSRFLPSYRNRRKTLPNSKAYLVSCTNSGASDIAAVAEVFKSNQSTRVALLQISILLLY